MSTPRQDFFTKNPRKNWFSWGTIRTPQVHKSNSSRWIIFLILLCGAGVAVYFFWQESIKSFVVPIENTEQTGYTIASKIEQKGILKEESKDLITYTHTLTTAQGETFLLKSRTIPLSNYTNTSWEVQIIGTLESFYQDKPLIEVESILTDGSQEQKTTTTWTTSAAIGTYIAKAGLYFGSDFFENYAFVGTPGADDRITVQNMENAKTTTINFFTCGQSNDTNCQQLVTTFKSSAVSISTSANADVFYALETNSRFFQNNNWRGYFIHDADTQEVEKLKNLITIVNPALIQKIVSQHGVKVCLGSDNGLNRISSHTVKKTAQGLEVTLQGTGEKEFTCTAMIDLSKANQLTFVDIKTKASVPTQTGATEAVKELPSESIPSQTSTTSTTQISSSFNPQVTQFPTSTEKTLTYTSSRSNYALTFPSMNISYEVYTPTQTPNNLKCNYALRAIQYKNKDLLSTSPAINIYECKSGQNLSNLGENTIIKELWDKNFVIEVLDGAWRTFANTISIASLSGTEA